VELPTSKALFVEVDLPVPPEVPGRAVVRESVFATRATETVEFAVMERFVEFVVSAPEIR
jgi:hypothetical protein